MSTAANADKLEGASELKASSHGTEGQSATTGQPVASSTSASTVPKHPPQFDSAEVDRPLLGRLDEKKHLNEELEKRRFNIGIISIFYHQMGNGTVGCAIILKISFDVKMVDKFASATFPLSVLAVSVTDPAKINITGHFPPDTEWAEVGHISGTKLVSTMPNVQISTPGGGVSVSGVGVQRATQLDISKKISLDPVLRQSTDEPSKLTWKCEDPHSIYYPRHMEILVVVEKKGNPDLVERGLWFPFKLVLNPDLQVNIAGAFGFLRRFWPKNRPHDGWCFNIKGDYQPAPARDLIKAINTASDDVDPKAEFKIGLRAAVKRWEGSTSPQRASVAPTPMSVGGIFTDNNG